MFLEYYGLREQPFGVTPDPRFLYLGPAHVEALASLFYGVEASRGFMALVAQPGMGKTTLLFQLMERLRKSSCAAFLFQTQCNSREFLQYLLADLGITSGEQDLVKMHEQLNEALLSVKRSGRRFVLVIDEAQNLDDEVLETVRLLSDFETTRAKLMQIILAGQPQLADKLNSPHLVQLRQRISILTRLDPFAPEETSRYIDHRLRVAGYQGGMLFTPEARALIAARSHGIPRNINNLCFNALSAGYAKQQKKIDTATVQEVLADLDLAPFMSEEGQVATPVEASTAAVPLEGYRGAEEGWFGRRALQVAALAALLVVAGWLVFSFKGGAQKFQFVRPAPSAPADLPASGSAAPAEGSNTTSAVNPAGMTSEPASAPKADMNSSPHSISAPTDASNSGPVMPAGTSGGEPNTAQKADSKMDVRSATGQSARSGLTERNRPRGSSLEQKSEVIPHPSGASSAARVPLARSVSQAMPAPAQLTPAQRADLRDKLVLAGFFMDRNMYAEAIEAFHAALHIDSSNRDAQAGMARAHQAQGAQKVAGPAGAKRRAATPRPIRSAANLTPARGVFSVVVGPKQTLRQISLRYEGRFDQKLFEEIRKLNPELKDANYIQAGQRVRLPWSTGLSKDASRAAEQVSEIKGFPRIQL